MVRKDSIGEVKEIIFVLFTTGMNVGLCIAQSVILQGIEFIKYTLSVRKMDETWCSTQKIIRHS